MNETLLKVYKKRLKLTGIAIFLSLLPFSCVKGVHPPSWFLKPPQERGILFSAGTDKSKDLATAFNRARLNALSELAGQLKVKIKEKFEIYEKEMKTPEKIVSRQEITQKIESIVKQSLQGAKVREQEYVKK